LNSGNRNVRQVKENHTILHRQDPTLPKIDLLLLFMKGDSRIPDAFGWSVSIRTKMNIVSILFDEVLEQIPKPGHLAVTTQFSTSQPLMLKYLFIANHTNLYVRI